MRSNEGAGFEPGAVVLLLISGGVVSLGVFGAISVLLLARRPLTLDSHRVMPMKTVVSPILWRGSALVTSRLVLTRLSRSSKAHSLFGLATLMAVAWLALVLWKPTNGAMWTAPVLQVVSVCLGTVVVVSLGVESGGRYPEILRMLGIRKWTLAYILILGHLSILILLVLGGVSSRLGDWTILLGAIVLLSIALPGGALCGWMLQPVVGSSVSESSGVAMLFSLIVFVPLIAFGSLQNVILRYVVVGCVVLVLLVSAIFVGEARLARPARTRE